MTTIRCPLVVAKFKCTGHCKENVIFNNANSLRIAPWIIVRLLDHLTEYVYSSLFKQSLFAPLILLGTKTCQLHSQHCCEYNLQLPVATILSFGSALEALPQLSIVATRKSSRHTILRCTFNIYW